MQIFKKQALWNSFSMDMKFRIQVRRNEGT
jgi:hypothetical protein